MKIGYHVLASLISFGALSTADQLTPAHLTASMMGGVFIDLIDHGIYSYTTLHPFSVKKAIEQHARQHEKLEPKFYFFHTAEVFLLLYFLLHRYVWGNFFLVSYVIHLLMDAGRYIYFRLPTSIWLGKWSVVYMAIHTRFSSFSDKKIQ